MSVSYPSTRLIPMCFVLLLGFLQSGQCAENDAPAVKLSDSGICHARGTSSYAATLHYEAFDTVADCIKAGGRLAKASRRRLADTEGKPAPSISQELKENPGVAVIRNIEPKYIAIGAMAVIAIGISVTFVRFRSRRYRFVNKRVLKKRGSPPGSGTGELSADERRLLRACLGSREVAERLIQFELERNPALSRDRAAAAAVRRLARDNK
jgi:hypothetical protein